MTPPVPSSNDITRLSSKRRQITRLIVNAVPSQVVTSARVNMASISYPLANVTVDSTDGDWLTEGLAGRRFGIGTAPGLSDIADGVLRFNVSSTIAYIDPRYAGQGGHSRDIAQLIANDHYLSIFADYPAYGVQSSIRSGIFYKLWDQQFVSASRDPSPIINLGTYPRTDATTTAQVTINADVFHFAGRSYSSHAWSAPTGTIDSSDADSATITFPPGCHEVRYRQTDTRGKSTTVNRKVFVNGPGFRPLCGTIGTAVGQYRFIRADCTQDRTGYTITLTIGGPVDPGDFYPGQLFALHEIASWADGETLDNPDAVAHTFIAYLGETGLSTTPDSKEVTLTLYAPMTLADKIVVPKQTIIQKAAPTNWSEVIPALANPVGYAWYLAELHAPYLLHNHDFDFDPAFILLRRQAAEFAGSDSLGAHLQQLAGWLNGPGVVGSRTDGTTRMLRHPNYMDTAERNALPLQWTYLPGQIRQRLDHTYRWWPTVGRAYAGSFASQGIGSTVAHRAVAPGFINTQAPGETSLEDTIVPYTGTLSDVMLRTMALSGYHLAAQNARTQIEPTLVDRNLDVAQPVDLDRRYVFDIPATYDALGEGWSNVRRWPTEVRRVWTGEGKDITVSWEPETFGYPGQNVPYNSGAGGLWLSRYVPDGFQPYAPLMPVLGYTPDVMTAWGSSLRDGWTNNFATPNATFERIITGGLGTVFAALNTHSPYFSDPADPLYRPTLIYNGNDLALYNVQLPLVINDSPILTLLNTWLSVNDAAETGFKGHAALVIDRETADFWVFAYRNFAGTHVYRSTDGGANWDAGVRFGHADPVNVGETTPVPMALAVFDERIVLTASDGTQDDDDQFIYSVYTAVGSGSFTKVDNPTGYRVAPASICLTSATNAVVGLYRDAAPEPDDALDVVDFEVSGGYPNYTVSGTGQASGVDEFAGQRWAYSSFDSSVGGTGAGGVAVNVVVDLTAFYTLNAVTFDVGHVFTSVTGPSGALVITARDAEGTELRTFTETFDSAFPDETEHSFTAEEMGMAGLHIWELVVSVQLAWASVGVETITVQVDNIDIDATLVNYATDRALHTLNLSGPTYTRRQSFQLLPSLSHFGLAYGGQSNLVLAICVDENGDDTWLLRSTDNGANWTKIRSVPGFIGLKVAADMTINGTLRDVAILFGSNRLHVSINGGLSSHDAQGDYASTVGPLNRIEGVAGILNYAIPG